MATVRSSSVDDELARLMELVPERQQGKKPARCLVPIAADERIGEPANWHFTGNLLYLKEADGGQLRLGFERGLLSADPGGKDSVEVGKKEFFCSRENLFFVQVCAGRRRK